MHHVLYVNSVPSSPPREARYSQLFRKVQSYFPCRESEHSLAASLNKGENSSAAAESTFPKNRCTTQPSSALLKAL